jgi:hypothetical protein
MGVASGSAALAHDLGLLASRRRRWSEAHAWFLASARDWQALGEEARAADPVWALANVATALGRLELAARLWGTEAALRERSPAVEPEEVRAVRDTDLAATREALGAAAFRRAWRRGRDGTLERTLDEVAEAGVPAG